MQEVNLKRHGKDGYAGRCQIYQKSKATLPYEPNTTTPLTVSSCKTKQSPAKLMLNRLDRLKYVKWINQRHAVACEENVRSTSEQVEGFVGVRASSTSQVS